MRKLALKDAFALSRILKAAEIKKEIMAFANEIRIRNKQSEKLNTDEIGLEFILSLVTAISNTAVEKQFYDLYASIKEIDPKDAEFTDLETFKNDIMQIAKENDLKSFFTSLSALT